jgi:hypothetical protein
MKKTVKKSIKKKIPAKIVETKNYENMEVSEIKLKKEMACVVQEFNSSLVANCNIDVIKNELGNMVVKLDRTIWGEDLRKDEFTLDVKYPADWIQAFKLRFFPEWLMKRYPVKYATASKTYTVEDKALFPNLVVSQPNQAYVVKQYVKESPVTFSGV